MDRDFWASGRNSLRKLKESKELQVLDKQNFKQFINKFLGKLIWRKE